MNQEELRRQAQLDFVGSGQELSVGEQTALPLPLEELQASSADSAHVLQSFASGLTAEVFHIVAQEKEWTLKLARPESLVKNVDGQTSFLNEVQRRKDFEQLKKGKAPESFSKHIVDTHYASFKQGIILSPWLPGQPLNHFNERVLTQLFDVLIQLELHGFCEWDFCPGNIVDDGNNVALFDFGYCYRFDPLKDFNSNGIRDPLFHSIERLETRNFFAHLLQLEQTWSEQEILSLYELEKRLALQAYQFKLSKLKLLGASQTVLAWQQSIIDEWQQALSSPACLGDLFIKEAYRSHLIDLYDDLHGQSCTPMTIKRLDRIEVILKQHYDLLKSNDGLFFGDEELSQAQLLKNLAKHRENALKFQL